MIPIFQTPWFSSFTLWKCSKRGPSKMGGWHLDLSALKWAKKRAFLEIFDKIFFIFQKVTFFMKITSWDCKNVSKKRQFFFRKHTSRFQTWWSRKKLKMNIFYNLTSCFFRHKSEPAQYDERNVQNFCFTNFDKVL